MPRTITSLEGYTRKISEIQPAPDEVLLYRGHPRKEFKLLPSVLRDPKFQEAEHAILRELVASHPAEFASDTTTLERLVRVQHYSLPTRLSDVKRRLYGDKGEFVGYSTRHSCTWAAP